jgi:hypothetical protein
MIMLGELSNRCDGQRAQAVVLMVVLVVAVGESERASTRRNQSDRSTVDGNANVGQT